MISPSSSPAVAAFPKANSFRKALLPSEKSGDNPDPLGDKLKSLRESLAKAEKKQIPKRVPDNLLVTLDRAKELGDYEEIKRLTVEIREAQKATTVDSEKIKELKNKISVTSLQMGLEDPFPSEKSEDSAMAKGAILTDEELAAGKKDAEAASRKSEERSKGIERAIDSKGDSGASPEEDKEDKDSSTDTSSKEGANDNRAEPRLMSKSEAEAQKILNEEEAKKAAVRARIPYETIPMGGGAGAGFLRTPRAVMAQVAMRGGMTPQMKAAEQSAANASIAEINRLRETDPEAARQMQTLFMGRRPINDFRTPEGTEVVRTTDRKQKTSGGAGGAGGAEGSSDEEVMVSQSTRIPIPEKYGGGFAYGDTGKGRGTGPKGGRFSQYGTGETEFGGLTRSLMDNSYKPGTGIVDREAIKGFGKGTTGLGKMIVNNDVTDGQIRDQARRGEEFEKFKKQGMAADLAAKQKKDDDDDDGDDDDKDKNAAAKVKRNKDLMNRTMNRTMVA